MIDFGLRCFRWLANAPADAPSGTTGHSRKRLSAVRKYRFDSRFPPGHQLGGGCAGKHLSECAGVKARRCRCLHFAARGNDFASGIIVQLRRQICQCHYPHMTCCPIAPAPQSRGDASAARQSGRGYLRWSIPSREDCSLRLGYGHILTIQRGRNEPKCVRFARRCDSGVRERAGGVIGGEPRLRLGFNQIGRAAPPHPNTVRRELLSGSRSRPLLASVAMAVVMRISARQGEKLASPILAASA